MKNPKIVQTNNKLIMNINAINIDWNKSIREAEEFLEYECSFRHIKKICNIDAPLYAVKLLYDIKEMYRIDDICMYLETLNKNKIYLKRKK